MNKTQLYTTDASLSKKALFKSDPRFGVDGGIVLAIEPCRLRHEYLHVKSGIFDKNRVIRQNIDLFNQQVRLPQL